MTTAPKRPNWTAVALVLAGFWSACGRTPQGSLKSTQGAIEGVEIVSSEQRTLAHLGPSLLITYETKIDAQDRARLEAEVERVWGVFHDQADAAGVKAVVILAEEQSKSLPRQSFGFVFKRDQDGKWQRSSGFTS